MDTLNSQGLGGPNNPTLAEELALLYDEIVELETHSAVLCDGLCCMVAAQLEPDDSISRGMRAFSSYLKRRLEELKTTLKQIQQRSSNQT